MLVRSLPHQTQIVVLEGPVLVEHYVARSDKQSLVGNVYLGKVRNVLPGMEAAFVDFGVGKNGVLYAGDIHFDPEESGKRRPRIEKALKLGDDILVGAQYESSCPFSLPTEDDEFQAGAAYWFERNTGTWSELDILKGPIAMGSTWYGVSVDLSSELFVVGAEIASSLDGSAVGGGVVYAHAHGD